VPPFDSCRRTEAVGTRGGHMGRAHGEDKWPGPTLRRSVGRGRCHSQQDSCRPTSPRRALRAFRLRRGGAKAQPEGSTGSRPGARDPASPPAVGRQKPAAVFSADTLPRTSQPVLDSPRFPLLKSAVRPVGENSTGAWQFVSEVSKSYPGQNGESALSGMNRFAQGTAHRHSTRGMAPVAGWANAHGKEGGKAEL